MPAGQGAFKRRYNIFKDNFLAYTFSGTEFELRNRLTDLANRYPEAKWDALPFDRRNGQDRRNTEAAGPL